MNFARFLAECVLVAACTVSERFSSGCDCELLRGAVLCSGRPTRFVTNSSLSGVYQHRFHTSQVCLALRWFMKM